MEKINRRKLRTRKEYQIEEHNYRYLGPHCGVGLPEFARYLDVTEKNRKIERVIFLPWVSIELKGENKLDITPKEDVVMNILKSDETKESKRQEFSRLNKKLEGCA